MSDEKIMNDMEAGNKEEDVYTEEGREKLVEDDEISEVEEGFVQGYEEGKTEVYCQTCNKTLVDENFIEEEIEGKQLRFCSSECAGKYEKTH